MFVYLVRSLPLTVVQLVPSNPLAAHLKNSTIDLRFGLPKPCHPDTFYEFFCFLVFARKLLVLAALARTGSGLGFVFIQIYF